MHRSSIVPMRFSGSSNFSGAAAPNSSMFNKVNKCKKQIMELAKAAGVSLQDESITILKNSDSELDAYIRSRNEVPVDTINGRILQSALLRLEDYSLVARTTGVSDAEAVMDTMKAESEVVDMNGPDTHKILTPSTQAALHIVIDQLCQQMYDMTSAKSYSDTLDLVRQSVASPKDHNIPADNFSWGTISNKANYAVGDTDTNTGTLGAVTVYPTTDNSGDGSSSVWDLLGNVVDNASSVSNAAKSIGQTITSTAQGVSQAIGTTGSNIGAAAIGQYISQNILPIFLFIILIVLIILFTRGNK